MPHARTIICLLAAVLLAACPACASGDDAQCPPPADKPKEEPQGLRKYTIVPTLSTYLPASGKAQDRFGESWSSFGLSIGRRGEDKAREGFRLRIDSIRGESGGNRAHLYPVGLAYTRRLPDAKAFAPYAGLGASVCAVDLRSAVDGVDTGVRATSGACLFVGAYVGSRVNVEATYYTISRIEGFELGGLKLAANMRL